jgi:ornithine carbamoyltransferase
MKKDFLSFDDIKRTEIFNILDLAEELKKKPLGKQLHGKTFCLYFEKPSLRTRISFETGIGQLGGTSIYLDKNTTQISRGETMEDTARTLNRYVDAIIVRVFSHETLEIMSKNTDIHVINALSDLTHPCQILSDLLTIREKFGSFEDLKLAYVGDGNNVCNSLLLGCSKVGIDINVACPKEYQPNTNIIHRAIDFTKITKSDINIMEDPVEAVKNANIVYTDTWVSMGQVSEREKKLKVFSPKYQVNRKLLNFAASNVLFMHCLMAHRGEEVTHDVIDGLRSIVWDQAENRLHAQKALLVKMMGKNR